MILKATALVSLLGLEDVVKATQLAGKSTWEPFYFAVVCGTYLPGIYHRFQWCAALT
ncbi:histidine transporter permease [Salmonella enterica subsp. enterica serovar Typhimurium]|nr:histidine transporter permease [Salmonella enterica subsp. enterica serovar Typhimurium]